MCVIDERSCCLFTERSPVDSTGCVSDCDQTRPRRAAGEVTHEDERVCANVTASSRLGRGPCPDAINDATPALHNRVQRRLESENALPTSPFIDSFNGVVSRRALLKVTALFCYANQTLNDVAAELGLQESAHSNAKIAAPAVLLIKLRN